jgi:hypothetical protein
MARPKKKDMRIRKVGAALESLAKATEEIKFLYARMSFTQQKLFTALASGQDELHACLSAGIRQGIVKIVYNKEGRPLYARNLTVKSVDSLDNDSYERLLRVARATVRRYLDGYDYNTYQMSINETFQLLAPKALGTLLQIMHDGTPRQRLKAATFVLDRAGYTKTNEPPNEPIPTVHIVMDDKPYTGEKTLAKY